jgi:hypothetical protein
VNWLADDEGHATAKRNGEEIRKDLVAFDIEIRWHVRLGEVTCKGSDGAISVDDRDRKRCANRRVGCALSAVGKKRVGEHVGHDPWAFVGNGPAAALFADVNSPDSFDVFDGKIADDVRLQDVSINYEQRGPLCFSLLACDAQHLCEVLIRHAWIVAGDLQTRSMRIEVIPALSFPSCCETRGYDIPHLSKYVRDLGIPTQSVMSLDGTHAIDDGNARGRGKAEGRWRDWGVGLFAGKGEAGDGTVGFLDLDADDRAVGGDCQGEALDAVFLVVGDAGQIEIAVDSG